MFFPFDSTGGGGWSLSFFPLTAPGEEKGFRERERERGSGTGQEGISKGKIIRNIGHAKRKPVTNF